MLLYRGLLKKSLFTNNTVIICVLALSFTTGSAVAQWKRAGLITLMSLERNQAALVTLLLPTYKCQAHPAQYTYLIVLAVICPQKSVEGQSKTAGSIITCMQCAVPQHTRGVRIPVPLESPHNNSTTTWYDNHALDAYPASC